MPSMRWNKRLPISEGPREAEEHLPNQRLSPLVALLLAEPTALLRRFDLTDNVAPAVDEDRLPQ